MLTFFDVLKMQQTARLKRFRSVRGQNLKKQLFDLFSKRKEIYVILSWFWFSYTWRISTKLYFVLRNWKFVKLSFVYLEKHQRNLFTYCGSLNYQIVDKEYYWRNSFWSPEMERLVTDQTLSWHHFLSSHSFTLLKMQD